MLSSTCLDELIWANEQVGNALRSLKQAASNTELVNTFIRFNKLEIIRNSIAVIDFAVTPLHQQLKQEVQSAWGLNTEEKKRTEEPITRATAEDNPKSPIANFWRFIEALERKTQPDKKIVLPDLTSIFDAYDKYVELANLDRGAIPILDWVSLLNTYYNLAVSSLADGVE